MSYEEALKRTDPTKCKTVSPGSAEEKAAIERFKDYWSCHSLENVRDKIRNVYAESAYFTDTLKEVNGIDAIEAYFLKSLKSLELCTFEFPDIAVSGSDYYIRWVGDMKYKNFKKGQVVRSHGMTHVRFDEKGKVVLHQDFWDSTSAVFEHVPLLGGVIKLLKRTL